MMSENNATISYAGRRLHPAVMFINSNKAERNIRRMVRKAREKCICNDIWIGHDIVVTKGPERDIDREAVNTLIGILMCGQYEVVIVDKITDITEDADDLNSFLYDAAQSGIRFFELSAMEYFKYDNEDDAAEEETGDLLEEANQIIEKLRQYWK